jgi:hypothetical protein
VFKAFRIPALSFKILIRELSSGRLAPHIGRGTFGKERTEKNRRGVAVDRISLTKQPDIGSPAARQYDPKQD